MAHTLTDQELLRFREAFANWDMLGEGTIPWPSLLNVMEEVGEVPSAALRQLSSRPDCEDQWISFDEFLNIVVGPPWVATAHDEEEVLTEAIAEFDDGDGYVPLRDLMRVLQKHMEDSGYNPTDDELVDVYRQALEGSAFETAGGGAAPEDVWKVFQEEFADFRVGPKMKKVDFAIPGQTLLSTSSKRKCSELLARLRFVRLGPARCFRRLCSQLGRKSVDRVAVRDQAGEDGGPKGETAHMMNITVVDLGGNQLMSEAVASTWSVYTLQQHIAAVVGVPVHRQSLSLAGDDGFGHGLCASDGPLPNAGVVDGSTLVLAAKDEVKVDYKKFVARLMDL